MIRTLALLLFCGVAIRLPALEAPTNLVSRIGDRSIVLHWDRNMEAGLSGYRVYRAFNADGPFTLHTPSTVKIAGYCDLGVTNGQTYYYRVTSFANSGLESLPSSTLAASPRPFPDTDAFLEYVQQTCFDYFWYGANPNNGLVPDRAPSPSPCSIAAVGFGLSAIGIGVDHGWITRTRGLERARVTLNTFLQKPQGAGTSGTIGYNGWFYHFLDMNTALRYTTFNTELSSIDTALFLAGVLDAKQFFDGPDPAETELRATADAILNRVDWNWMARGTNVLSMGWQPASGFLSANWVGYNEAMILYLLGMGAATNPLPETAWQRWTNGYFWMTSYGQSFVRFPPLFGHQYSHCWVDFRHVADPYMNARQSTYFENSRRATLAQRSYCITNSLRHTGYSSNVWGITACDGPTGYSARGAPPAENDDGTIAPTAPGGSVPFAPEFCIPALRHLYDTYRTNIWTSYGFRDAFNLGKNWWGADTLGIDQGPILLMIENYRTQKVWRRVMRNPEIQRGLQRAGFVPLSFMSPRLEPLVNSNAVSLTWGSLAGRSYQVEFSPDLSAWFGSPAGRILASETTSLWVDPGPPATPSPPFNADRRFYRVYQFGLP